ncbi:HTH-type transcriptional activator Btr [compost metagenome]
MMNAFMREDPAEYLEVCFFTPSCYEKSGGAWPIRLGRNIAKPHYHIGPRTSPYYYLIFVLKGSGILRQNHETYNLQPNDVFCLFPQVQHEYYTNPDDLLHKAFIAFDGKHALRLLERIGLTPHHSHSAGLLSPELMEVLEEFFRLAESREGRNTDLGRLAMFHLIFDRLGILANGRNGVDSRKVTWLQKGREYMEIHYAEGITVEKAAEHAGVERTYFTKQFRKAYGITPILFIQELKMKEARQLLEQTSYTLAEIADSVGYPDLFSFSKAFKRHTGIPPARYRLQMGHTVRHT